MTYMSQKLMNPSKIQIPHWHTILPSMVIGIVSWLIGLYFVYENDWFGWRDLYTFAYWNVLCVLVAYPIVRLFQHKSLKRSNLSLLSLASFVGIIFGFFFTVLVYLLLGPWIAGFGFNVLFCWVTGAVVGLLCSITLIRPAIWVSASSVAVLVPALVAVLWIWLCTPPQDAIILFKSDITREEVELVWEEVFSKSGEESFTAIGGVGSGTLVGNPGHGLRVTFLPGTSEAERAEVLERAQALPFVSTIVDTERLTKEDIKERRKLLLMEGENKI